MELTEALHFAAGAHCPLGGREPVIPEGALVHPRVVSLYDLGEPAAETRALPGMYARLFNIFCLLGEGASWRSGGYTAITSCYPCLYV